MSSRLQVFQFGDNNQSADAGGDDRYVAAGPAALDETDSATLNRRLQSSDADIYGFADVSQSPPAALLDTVSQCFEERAEASAVLVPFWGAGLLATVWERMPASLAALAWNPLQFAWLFVRSSAIDDQGPCRDVTQPLWDWIIRAAGDGRQIDFLPLEGEAEAPGVGRRTNLPALAPKQPPRTMGWLWEHLRDASVGEMLGQPQASADATALDAGLLQIHDYLDESHNRSQSVEGGGKHRAGDYWHAIMHRREPDYSNSKYWFRNVGSHPVFSMLARSADRVLLAADGDVSEAWRDRLLPGGRWDPFAFVDFCQHCQTTGDAASVAVAEQIQFDEMLLLLLATYDDAA